MSPKESAPDEREFKSLDVASGKIDGREAYTKQEWEAKRARILATPLPGEKPACPPCEHHLGDDACCSCPHDPLKVQPAPSHSKTAASVPTSGLVPAAAMGCGKAGVFHFIDDACDDLKKHDDQLGYCINNCAFVTPAECHECLKDNADLYQAEQLESIDEPEEK